MDGSVTRLAVIGGFLGAGKTTLIARRAGLCPARGLRVGIVTNDKGDGLVDTAYLKGLGLSAHEMRGGCFCTNFDTFAQLLLSIGETEQPDIIFAEPVGSYLELAATLLRPLQENYAGQVRLAPLCAVVDCARILRYDEHVKRGALTHLDRLFARQIQESDLVLLNKADLYDLDTIVEGVDVAYSLRSESYIQPLCAATGERVDEVLDILLGYCWPDNDEIEENAGDLAEAETALAWLNCSYTLEQVKSARRLVEGLAASLRHKLAAGEIAHVKLYFTDGKAGLKAGIAGEHAPACDGAEDMTGSLRLLVNARALCDAKDLAEYVNGALQAGFRKQGIAAQRLRNRAFMPGRAAPQKRVEKPGT